MGKLGNISGKEAVKAFGKAGWNTAGQVGSHLVMVKPGIIAAAGIVALESMIDRLAEDQANAMALARGIHDIPGFRIDLDKVETNMVYVDHSGTGLSTDEVISKLKAAGVVASALPPNRFRLVTNRHHDHHVIEEALTRIRSAMEA